MYPTALQCPLFNVRVTNPYKGALVYYWYIRMRERALTLKHLMYWSELFLDWLSTFSSAQKTFSCTIRPHFYCFRGANIVFYLQMKWCLNACVLFPPTDFVIVLPCGHISAVTLGKGKMSDIIKQMLPAVSFVFCRSACVCF